MAFDAFLKIAGIPGDSSDSKFKDCIEILSYSHGVSQLHVGSVSGSGSHSAGRADVGHFNIVKRLDKASPKLALACCNGEHLKDVTLTLNRSGKDKVKFMEYKLTDVLVTSAQGSGSPSDVPVENVSFTFGKIEWTYTETDLTGAKKGDVKTSWSLKENKGA